MGTKAVIIVLGSLGLAEESLRHVGFTGNVITLPTEALAQDGVAKALAAYKDVLIDAGVKETPDVVCIIDEYVLASHSPAPLFDQIAAGPDKVYAPALGKTIGALADRLELPAKVAKACQDDPAVKIDVLAFRPGTTADELFYELKAYAEGVPLESLEMLLNKVNAYALGEDVVALPGVEAFDGFRGYAGPFVIFGEPQAAAAREWLTSRTQVHTQEVAGEVRAEGQLAVKKVKKPKPAPQEAGEGEVGG
jgi:hypothetical protein